MGWTKEERAAYMRKYWAEHKEERRAYHRRWLERYPDKRKALRNRHKIADPLKQAARVAVANAIYTKCMARGAFCQLCLTDKKIEAHHPDYTKKLDVIWLCGPCHRGIHGNLS